MTVADRERWDAKYAAYETPLEIVPPDWLVASASQLKPGRALDLACGLGHSAIWLAQRGWDVTAIDISPLGLRFADQLASQSGVSVHWQIADLDDVPLGDSQFDLITVFRFLDRNTLPARIMSALRPGGRLLYETFLAGESAPGTPHVQNPAFLLQSGELPKMFHQLQVLAYDEATLGSVRLARLAAIRRPGA